MARFRCPSTLEESGSRGLEHILADSPTVLSTHVGPSSSGSQAKSSKPTRPRCQKLSERRPRSKQFSERRRKVDMARKAEDRRAQVQRTGPSHVFVGNISSSASENTLREIFHQRCGGMIVHLSIRCASGTMDTNRGQHNFYAVVAFNKASAAKKALDVNGQKCNGQRLIVTQTPFDLPELAVPVSRSTRKRGIHPRNPVRLEPTILDLEPSTFPPMPPARRQAGAAKNIFMGVSFGKSVI